MMNTRCRHIFFFTGQGAQYTGMGRSLYRTEPVFRQWMDDLDRICLEKESGSVRDLLYAGSHAHGPSGKQVSFDDVTMSHPALFMVQFALAKTLIHRGVVPHCLVGASLGEYVALALAGVISPQAMLAALIDHARALGTFCAPGAMIGIADNPGRYDRDPVIHENSSLAGISTPMHFVVAGERIGMEKVHERLMETDTQFQKLPVRFGFHSPNIEPALPVWNRRLEKMADDMNVPKIDVISCCTGTWVKEVEPDFLTDIGRRPILFPRALKTLDLENTKQLPSAGAHRVNILDLGPGAWSSGFVRQNKILGDPVRIYRVMTRFGNELKNMNKIKEELILS